MPYPPEVEAKALQDNGYDPAMYMVGDDGRVYHRPISTNPVVSSIQKDPLTGAPTLTSDGGISSSSSSMDSLTTPAPITPQATTQTDLATGLSHAVAGVPSAGVGAVVGSGAMTALRYIAAMGAGAAEGDAVGGGFTPADIITIPAGIYAGYKAAGLARQVQDAITPQSSLNYLSQGEQQNPLSATAGNIAANLPFMKPTSIPNTLGSASRVAKAITAGTRNIDPGDIGTLFNTGLGAAIPAANSAVALAQGKKVDPWQTALEILGGAYISDPREYMGAVGLHPNQYGTDPNEVALRQEALAPDSEVASPTITPTAPSTSDILQAFSGPDTRGLKVKQNNGGEPSLKATDAMPSVELGQPKTAGQYVVNPEEVDTSTLEGEGGITPSSQEKTIPVQQIQSDADDSDIPIARSISDEIQGPTPTPMSKPASENALRYLQLGSEVARPEVKQNTTGGDKEPEVLPAGQSEAEDIQDKLEAKQSEESPLDKVVKELNDSGIDLKLTKAWSDAWANLGRTKRNVETVVNPSLVSIEDGKPIAGRALVQKGVETGLSEINPNKALKDTAPHEMFHHFMEFTRQTNPNLAARLENTVSKLPEYQSWKASRDSQKLNSTPEEYLAQNVGVEAVRRLMLPDKGLSNWYKDFTAHIKTKLLGNAKTEDLARFMTNKLINDRPVFQDYAKLLHGQGSSSQEQSNRSSLSKSIPYGYWINPEGNFHPVTDSYGHDSYAYDLLGAPKSYIEDSPSEQLSKKGWTRAVYDRNKEQLMSTTEKEINPKVRKQLEDWGIENNKSVVNYEYNGQGKTDYIHTDEPKQSEQSQLGLDDRNVRAQSEFDKMRDINRGTNPNDSKEAASKLFDYNTLSSQQKSTYGQLHEDAMLARQNHDKIPSAESSSKLIDSELALKKFEDTNLVSKQSEKLPFEEEIKNEDIQKYNDLSSQMDSHISKKDFNSPEFMRLWQDREDIKNKYGGNVPKEEATATKIEESNKSPLEEGKTKEDTSYSTPFGIKALTPRADKIWEKFQNKTGKLTSEAINKHQDWVDRMEGQFSNVPMQKLFDSKLTGEQLPNVVKYLYELDRTGEKPNILLTKQQRDFVDAHIQSMKDIRTIQNKEKSFVVDSKGGLRVGGMKPEGYFPNMVDPKVMDTLLEHPNTPESKQLTDSWVKFQMQHGDTEEQALEALRQRLSQVNNQVTPDNEFKALNTAEGRGLPYDWIDKNLSRVYARYGRRAAQHIGFTKFFRDDPNMGVAFGLNKQGGGKYTQADAPGIDFIGGSKEGAAALRSIIGTDRTSSNAIATGLNRFVSNLMMGPGTAIRNLVQAPPFMLPYMKTSQLPVLAKALSEMGSASRAAFKNNATRADYSNFDVGEGKGTQSDSINNINKLSAILRKYQGRDLADKMEGTYTYTVGQILAKEAIAGAKTGDKFSKDWLNKFGISVDGGSSKFLSPDYKINSDDVEALAHSFVQRVRGTYSATGLPSVALEGPVSPFLGLTRWSIEKSNTVWKDTVLPIKQGNYAPILKLALGTLVSGAAIEQINHALSNRKDNDPTITEVEKYGDKKEVANKLLGLWQLGSAGGIVTDWAKLGSDAAMGKGLEGQNPLTFPLYSFVADNLVHNTGDLIKAINKDGMNPIDALGEYIKQIAKSSSQTYRYVNNNLIEPEKAERKDAYRDMRVEDELVNHRINPASFDEPNEISGHEMEEFKQTSDPRQAAAILPDLLQKAVTKANGNPELLRDELEKIRSNSYQTVPNPDNMPIQFARYMQFIQQTQGNDAMVKRYQDYIKMNAINRVKSSLVPQL